MINITQYLYFLQNCTGLSEKTTKNYTDFKRINECLQSLFPERKEFSLDDIEDPSELETIILQLQKLPLYIEYNEKGKNQYSATISTYLHFLYAKRMLLATKLNNISFEKKLIDSSRSNIQGEGLPRILNSAIKEALKIDKDLSKLKPEVTNKRLRIKRCNFAAELNNAKEIRPDKVNLDTVWKFHDKEYCVYNELSAENFSDFISQYNNAYFNTLSIEVENIDGSKIYNLYIFAHTPIITNTSYLPYLTALRTKPFMLLAGISGTGKSRIVRKLAQATNTKNYTKEEDRWKDNRPDNFQLIQVKPNWHNSMDVAGFLSNITTPHYVFTDFVRFIVKAWQHPETPYFLCLDEMNLAPVEEYFAEFLSAIESRAWDENGHYTTDPIISPFKDFGKEVCEAMLKELLGEAHHTEANPLAIQFENKGLTLPPNLMVMGTVNMDETTFSFSRKVLDRAMSVEMNEVNYDDFREGKTELMPLLTDYNDLLVNRPQKAQEVQEEINSQKVIDYLKAVNELLDGTPFKLGYRAANEAILYVAASQEFAKEAFSIETAMDEFTLMKILSRIEGDDSRLAIDENDERLQKAGLSESPLDNGEQNLTLLNGLRAIVRQHIGTNTATEKKINHMYTTLCREHFVSYWA